MKTECAKLEEEYPIGNVPQFPDKRVFHDSKTGFYFDLNASRLGVWAAAMVHFSFLIPQDLSLICLYKAQGKTDVTTPPINSRFFDANQHIKIVPTTTPIQPMTPTPSIVTPQLPLASNLSISDLLVASLLSQSGGLSKIFPQLHSNSNGTRTAPPSPIKRHSITTEQFCEMYDIDDIDCARLKDVGFRAGDPTDAKADNDLKEAGFTIFSWRRVHRANLRFKADLAAGVHNA
jgi:hypothetical protein